MRRKVKGTFKYVYFIYLTVLIIAAVCSIFYVRSLLKNYEAAQPERRVEEEISKLKSDATSGSLWEKYNFPEADPGIFEENIDFKATYESFLSNEKLTYSQKPGLQAEDTIIYNISADDMVMAEVILKRSGEPKTKLAVFTFSDWLVESVGIVFEKKNYTVEIPSDFSLKVNGTELTEKDAVSNEDSLKKFKIEGVYITPNFEIADNTGALAKYNILNGKVIPVLFDYTLTLPSSLTVTVNGELHVGEELEDHNIRHAIRMMNEPEVIISDEFGNKISYSGGNELPLTYLYLTVPEEYGVKIAGAPAPDSIVTTSIDPEYANFAEYCPDLPRESLYNIAVLKDNVDVSITDGMGQSVSYDSSSSKTIDLTVKTGESEIPTDVSAEVDVLDVSKKWSLFMSKDLNGYNFGFNEISKHLITSSYLYNVAQKWVNGIDISFISHHTLQNPPFSDESVTNYIRISENCFSVDISFVKHMILVEGSYVTDSMNSRFYFVKYDGNNDFVDNPEWKIADIKEIVE